MPAATMHMPRRYFAAAAAPAAEKDYYGILEVPSHATPEEIKEAYRALAKKYHPDVRSTADDAEGERDPDVEKFRDVVEAYQVLSVRESRAAFDISRRKNPHLYKASAAEQFEMMLSREERDKRGVSPRQAAARGSYAEIRMAELRKQREKYNANDLGYYKGGVPRADRGAIRGSALAAPGVFHSPLLHNALENRHPDSYRVTQEDAVKFKHYMGTDRASFNKTMPGYPMYYDRDHNYSKDRSFWLKFLVGAALVNYAVKRVQLEQDRARQTERLDGFSGQPAHHFHNRGGVLVRKQFTGFEKYHASSDDYMKWFHKAYSTSRVESEAILFKSSLTIATQIMRKTGMAAPDEAAILKILDEVWDRYDDDKNGYLDRDETRRFFTETLGNLGFSEDFTDDAFDEVFVTLDLDKSGTIEKEELVIFFKQLVGEHVDCDHVDKEGQWQKDECADDHKQEEKKE